LRSSQRIAATRFIFDWVSPLLAPIVTEFLPWRPRAANTGENLALRISFPFITPEAPAISGGRHGPTGRHAKFLQNVREALQPTRGGSILLTEKEFIA
jgi:hypothetical protein